MAARLFPATRQAPSSGSQSERMPVRPRRDLRSVNPKDAHESGRAAPPVGREATLRNLPVGRREGDHPEGELARQPLRRLMGNPADNPTGSVRDHYGPSLEPVGRWRGATRRERRPGGRANYAGFAPAIVSRQLVLPKPAASFQGAFVSASPRLRFQSWTVDRSIPITPWCPLVLRSRPFQRTHP